MGTWTENQIAALTGAALQYYNKKIASGMRPADALNATLAVYPNSTSGTVQPPSTTTAAQFRAAEAGISGSPTATEQQILQTLTPFDVQTSRFQPENVQPAFEGAAGVQPSPVVAQPSATGKKLIYQYKDAKGNTIGVYDDGSTEILSQGVADEKPTLARETFKKTLALMFGQEALTAAWVDELYGVVSGFYKTGSSVDESMNLALRDVRNNPNMKQFTNRFRGIFSLEDKLRAGEAVYVPTIAEYTATQQRMGEVLTAAGLKDLATLDFTSDLIGKNVSSTEAANRINNVFMTIDNAPDELKKSLREYFPMLTRSDLAKSLLLGEQGAKELEQKVAGISVKSAAAQQGLIASDPFNLAKSGITYSAALKGYGEIAQFLPTAQKLSAIYGGDITMPEAEAFQFGTAGSAAAATEMRALSRKERGAFGGASGVGGTSLGAAPTAGAL